MINLSYGSYDILNNIFNELYPLPKTENKTHGFLKTFKDLHPNIKNFMINLTQRITKYSLNKNENQFVITTSALNMMYFILVGLPIKKKKIYLEKPTYPVFYSVIEYLNKSYPGHFTLVDNPLDANVEYIIFPNNPDGQLFTPKTLNNKKSFIIYDTVYLYPHYFIKITDYYKAITIINKQILKINYKNKNFMIIQNLTQMSSCAGYRMSWCYISNPSLCNIIQKWTGFNNGISSIIADIFNQQLKIIDWNFLFKKFRIITKQRIKMFNSLFNLISKKTKIKLISYLPFLLVYDPQLKLYNYLLSNNIIVLIGNKFGISNDFLRIPIYISNINYDILCNNLKSFSIIS